MPAEATKIQFGDGLSVTDLGSGTIRVDGGGGVGPAGPEGPPGPPGTGGADKNYVHDQSILAVVWTVVHNLGKYVSVEVVNSGGNTIIPDMHYDSPNQVTLTFAVETSGKAYVN